ncbi:cysteine--tRNA ligase [Notoacmeibacter marinus]|uniref:Cysteine--tRNA ligase n=1 Tax=Notoacmeibacter marinus TaxID=1876515 RepID=A0A231UU49_9HYPH|nr:cysteine--tRNA ligase [Notoacmeibacter marinus]OXS99350.1 cysteine--tRNA ligase [Notoacmeibacter marinus]
MTELRLYNTMTRQKEVFEPADHDNVKMYVCGPTVYDYAHIGNARPAIVFDVLFRLLRHLYPGEGNAPDGSRIAYVRNITDVDDKINARALRDFGPKIDAGELTLNAAIRQVTETTFAQYQKDVAALGCLPPTVQPRATEFVLPRADGKTDMASLIQTLLDRGNAYIAQGGEGAEVLFDTASMTDYGRLSKRNLDEQQAGARIAVEGHKKNPADFVLWKESAADQPGWDAVFRSEGAERTIHGRPGWHIECSAMSAAYLGETFDIHGGGLDLIFPHHENEIAQSRCAHGSEAMARYWMHNGFLQVEGRKMSKSEGNFVTIADLLETDKFGGRKWPGEVLRLAMLMTHYREPIDFSVRRLEEASNIFEKWCRLIPAKTAWNTTSDRREIWENHPFEDVEALASLYDDIDFSRFFRRINELVDQVDRGESALAAFAALRTVGLMSFDHIISLSVEEAAQLIAFNEDHIQCMIDQRLAFIREKNWAEADRIRDELLTQGIQLKDSKDSETGERVTTWEVKR